MNYAKGKDSFKRPRPMELDVDADEESSEGPRPGETKWLCPQCGFHLGYERDEESSDDSEDRNPLARSNAMWSLANLK